MDYEKLTSTGEYIFRQKKNDVMEREQYYSVAKTLMTTFHITTLHSLFSCPSHVSNNWLYLQSMTYDTSLSS